MDELRVEMTYLAGQYDLHLSGEGVIVRVNVNEPSQPNVHGVDRVQEAFEEGRQRRE